MTFGRQLKAWREGLSITPELLSEKSGVSLEVIHALESLESFHPYKYPDGAKAVTITTYSVHCICDALEIDDISLYRNIIEKQRPAEYYLNQLEPGGTGTNEQRAIRLACHSVISFGRAAEILRINKYELPVLETTGCNCIECLDYIKSER
jgi:hypothetical protein